MTWSLISPHKQKVQTRPTSWVSSADPVRVGDAGDGEDVRSEEEASWDHGEFIHVGGHRWRSECSCASVSPGGRRDI